MKKEINAQLYEPIHNSLFELNIESNMMDKMNLEVLESQIIEFNYDEKYIRFNVNYLKHEKDVEIIPYDIVSAMIGGTVILKLKVFSKTNEVIFEKNFKAYFSEIKEFFNFDYANMSPTFMKVYFKEF